MPGPAPLPSRALRMEALVARPLEVLVVGGGITGAGIALDLALRGVRVGLVERGDWAAATSSASSRLVHGGLRYLEQLEIGLVRESCLERALLLRNAAGIVWPERFTFPVRTGDRVGRARLGAGLLLYALVSLPRPLGMPGLLSAAAVRRRVPGIDGASLRGGGSYLDGATDDARLTLAVATSAIEAGAVALTRVDALAIEAGRSGVSARLCDVLSGEEHTVAARAVVLAAGPFTDLLRARAGLTGGWVRPTRGSHVLVPRERLPTDGAVIFPSALDGRVMFLLPWPRATAIGTTDLDAEPEREPRCTGAEVRYLLASANALVPAAELGPDDVLSTWAGLRPLLAASGERPSERTREERIDRDGPIWTIAGGKLTAFRSMAERLAARLCDELALGRRGRRSPTRAHRLRGALADPSARPAWSELGSDGRPHPADPLDAARERRYAAHRAAVESTCAGVDGGGRALDPETLLGEVDWSVRSEDCLAATDFLWRRTDLGLAARPTAEVAAEAVLARLAEVCGWDATRTAHEREAVGAALERAHAWRRDP